MTYEFDEYDPKTFIEIGLAFGTLSGAETMIVAGRDGKPVTRLAKRAMGLGIAWTGTTVLDLRLMPKEIVKHEVKRLMASGGFYISYENNKFSVDLFDNEGDAVDEDFKNEIKKTIKGNKYSKVAVTKLGTHMYYPNAVDDYVNDIASEVSFKKPVNIIVDCQNSPMTMAVPQLFERYGITVSTTNTFFTGYATNQDLNEFLRQLKEGDFYLGLRLMPDTIEIYNAKGKKVADKKNIVAALKYIENLGDL
jgi:phosphomannomutase